MRFAARQAAPLSAEERFARLRLARSVNVGPRSYGDLIRRFGSGAQALEALPSLARRGGKRDYVPCPVETAEAEMAAGEAAGAHLVVIGEAAYPPLLAAIDNPPPVLWVRGALPVLQREAVGIVGARNASALGIRAARQITTELGELGWVIVSGLARGVDAAAHDAALATGTIAVLAGGIDRIYPAEHEDLAARIAETGALVSECPMGVEPTSRHFPKRNRLISGLGRGVLLVEAAIRSGSLITARYALEQGREVMACPGAPQDPRAGGCNALIRDGAALIRGAEDVIEALESPRLAGLAEPGSAFLFDADEYGDSTMRDDYDALADFDESGYADDRALSEQVLSLIGPHPVDLDEIARQCGASAAEMSLVMLELDLAGQVSLLPGGQIVRAEPAA
ncbi:DNA-processing protein DprA [Rhodobacteraceae bacterium NNCM2]|nr:DNA-processing protein DprA [Coraliihabitans acroporae]